MMPETTGQLFDLEEVPSTRPAARGAREGGALPQLHRIHAAPAAGKGGVSFDVGPVRWRPEGGSPEERRAMAYRLSYTWNLCEGMPTELLEDDEVWAGLGCSQRALLAAWRAGEDLTPHLQRLAQLEESVEARMDRLRIPRKPIIDSTLKPIRHSTRSRSPESCG